MAHLFLINIITARKGKNVQYLFKQVAQRATMLT